MKKYVKTNIFPIIVEVIFIISCFIVPREYYIYTNFCFYLILAIYKVALIITTLLGMLMYALEHSIAVWGIFLTMIWALPLSISYIKTKNIYVPMTAHFIGNLLGNGIDIIFTVIALISNG